MADLSLIVPGYVAIRYISQEEFDAKYGDGPFGKEERVVTAQPQLTPTEAAVYRALCDAADNGRVCPNVLDLLEIIGCESLSTPSVIVKRLEEKNLIAVVRYQRFRRVQILATGRWTARSPSMHVERPHVPRGAGSRSPAPTDRKPYKTRRK